MRTRALLLKEPPDLMRTSISHPLQIAEVTVADDFGKIGITFCPGKVQSFGQTGAWHRDLARSPAKDCMAADFSHSGGRKLSLPAEKTSSSLVAGFARRASLQA